MAFMAPLERMCLTSLLVSMSAIPVIPYSSRYSCSDCFEVNLLYTSEKSFTTSPEIRGPLDSCSSSNTP